MIRVLLCVLFLLAPPVSGHAQNAAVERRAAAEKLLDALKAAPSEEAAGQIESRVRQLWMQSTTPAVSLLMNRGARELTAGAHDEAIEVFNDAIVLDPNLAEAWHHRAIARFHAGDRNGAIHDIEETMKREPRHFAALRTLAEISASREDWKGAYAAWERLLQLDPKTPGGVEKIKDLRRRALGEEI
jgi:tetratricopeptide (TPR) repeat protein